MPLLAREGEASRVKVRDDQTPRTSRWSRVAMMATGAVALVGVATHGGKTSAAGFIAERLGGEADDATQYADQYKGPVFIHIPKNGGTAIELLAAYNGVRYVRNATRELDHDGASQKHRSGVATSWTTRRGSPRDPIDRAIGAKRTDRTRMCMRFDEPHGDARTSTNPSPNTLYTTDHRLPRIYTSYPIKSQARHVRCDLRRYL